MGYRLGNGMTSQTQRDRTVNFIQKDKDFYGGSLVNFQSICGPVIEKFDDKDIKKTHFSKQTGLSKRSA